MFLMYTWASAYTAPPPPQRAPINVYKVRHNAKHNYRVIYNI